MDLSTITGLLIGAGCIGAAMVFGDASGAWFDPVALLIVVGGAGAATLASIPARWLPRVPGLCLKPLLHRGITPRQQVVRLVSLSEVARREGVLALEEAAEGLDDPFMIRGMQLTVDGVEPDSIRSILQQELEMLIDRQATGRSLFLLMSRYTPAFGIIGSTISLIALLPSFDGSSVPGAGLAVVLLPMLYGFILSNLIFRPLADMLAARSREEVLVRSMAIQGVLSIQAGDTPRRVESLLQSYLVPGGGILSAGGHGELATGAAVAPARHEIGRSCGPRPTGFTSARSAMPRERARSV